MSKHTPGPWYFEDNGNYGEDEQPLGWISEYPSTAVHARPIFTLTPIFVFPKKKLEANARLMAAAPELLAALKTTLAICAHRWRALPSDAPEKVAIKAARAAIAKASP